MKCHDGHGRREGVVRVGEERKDRGRDGEEREEVYFAPSCKNSCGRA